jgi:hypothetical protein
LSYLERYCLKREKKGKTRRKSRKKKREGKEEGKERLVLLAVLFLNFPAV